MYFPSSRELEPARFLLFIYLFIMYLFTEKLIPEIE